MNKLRLITKGNHRALRNFTHPRHILAAMIAVSLPTSIALSAEPANELGSNLEDNTLRTYTGAWGTIQAGFVPDRSRIVDGEALFITFQVHNTGQTSIAFWSGGDSRGSVRHNRFTLIGRIISNSSTGMPLPDPHGYNHQGGATDRITLEPGQVHRETLLLQHWMTLPGKDTQTEPQPLGSFQPPFSISVTGSRTLTLIAEPPSDVLIPIASAFVFSLDEASKDAIKKIVDRYSVACKHRDPVIRRKAWIGLSYLGSREAIAVLIQELAVIDAHRRDEEHILSALSRHLEDKRVSPALAAFVTDPKRMHQGSSAREQACRLLSSSKQAEAKKALFHLARHERSSIQYAAIRHLARYPEKEVLPLLDVLFKDSSPTDWIRPTIVYARCELGEVFERDHLLPFITAWRGGYSNCARVTDVVSLFGKGDLADARALATCLRDEKNASISSFNHRIVSVIIQLGGPKRPYEWVDPPRADSPRLVQKLDQNKRTVAFYRAWGKGLESNGN